MIPLGASTACFYPMNTEKALERVGALGFRQAEVFLNSSSELSAAFAAQLRAIRVQYQMKIISIHPFTSFAESYFLFSGYERRYEDTLEFYKRYFDTANHIGASVVVIHGGKPPASIPEEEYFERFGRLSECGAAQGLTVAQENVVHFLSESPAFLGRMQAALGDRFAMVLDIKQAVRCGLSPLAVAEQFGKSIVHVHISDHDAARDCLPVGEGDFDFQKLLAILQARGYQGSYILELYRANFNSEAQLALSATHWNALQNF